MRNQLVALGLGANLETPLQFLRKALQEIKKIKDLQVMKISSIYESEAQLPEGAPEIWGQKYLNAVVLCSIPESFKPLEFLYSLKEIELKLGRLTKERWAPRTIDLDILTWQNVNLNSEELTLPHPRLQERPFALLPLIEVWPELPIPRPDWAQEWISQRPFQTKKSASSFWPCFVAILNITADSFSDGGSLLNPDHLLAQAEIQLKAGAEILDVGAESTRPGAAFVSSEVEFKNLKWALDQLRSLRRRYDFRVSLDCRRSDVVRQVLDHHRIDFLNDVSGFNAKEMQRLLKSSKTQAFVMHSLTIPPNSQDVFSDNEDPIQQLIAWWGKKIFQLKEAGISKENIIFDPGIGFGKTPEQNVYILKHLDQFYEIKESILIGHSRKSYQNLFSNQLPEKRDLETALVTRDLNLSYAQYLRVHDVESQKTALRF